MSPANLPPVLNNDEARLLRCFHLLSGDEKDRLLVAAGRSAIAACDAEVRKALAKAKSAQERAESDAERQKAIDEAEWALSEAYDDFYCCHLPSLSFPTWASLMIDFLGSGGLCEAIREHFDGCLGDALLGSVASVEGFALPLQSATEHAVLAYNLDRLNDDFFRGWALSEEDAAWFLHDWRAVIDVALEKGASDVASAGQ